MKETKQQTINRLYSEIFGLNTKIDELENKLKEYSPCRERTAQELHVSLNEVQNENKILKDTVYSLNTLIKRMR